MGLPSTALDAVVDCRDVTVVKGGKAAERRLFRAGLLNGRRRQERARMQMVFQDPYSSLDPRMSVHDIVAEPLRINGQYTAAAVNALLEQVGLTGAMGSRRPSGSWCFGSSVGWVAGNCIQLNPPQTSNQTEATLEGRLPAAPRPQTKDNSQQRISWLPYR